jgi:hypothetical protein
MQSLITRQSSPIPIQSVCIVRNIGNRPTLWKQIDPVPKTDTAVESESSYQIIHSMAGFDPTQSSPPNPFMEQLKQRMSDYFLFSNANK